MKQYLQDIKLLMTHSLNVNVTHFDNNGKTKKAPSNSFGLCIEST